MQPETFEQDADDVAGLLSYLKVVKANIFGFSNGGTTTMQIAIRHPAIVNKIVVASANYAREGMLPGFFDGMKNATLSDMPQILQDAFLRVTPDNKRLQVMFEKDKGRMLNFKDMTDDQLRSIKAKTMIMVSDRDVVTTSHGVKISQLIRGSQTDHIARHAWGIYWRSGRRRGERRESKKGVSLPEITASLVEDFLGAERKLHTLNKI